MARGAAASDITTSHNIAMTMRARRTPSRATRKGKAMTSRRSTVMRVSVKTLSSLENVERKPAKRQRAL